MPDGLMDPAAPPASDPGDISPPIERAAPRASATERPSFAQQRHAQELRTRAKPPANPQEAPAPGACRGQQTPAGDRVKVGRYETSESELAEMLTRVAADDVRKGTCRRP